MSRQVDFRSPLPHPADAVFAVMIDPDYLRARLQQIGGPGAALLEHTVTGDGARYRLRRQGPGSYAGDVEVQVPGTPVTASGRSTLRDAAPGSEFAVHADVTVNVPLLGGRIEETIVGNIGQLLTAETKFTESWLNRQH